MSLRVILIAGGICLASLPCRAQTATDRSPNTNISGSGDLSHKLNETNGVITPKGDTDPGIMKPAPIPNPHSTPVIPPPGTPGGPPGPQSK